MCDFERGFEQGTERTQQHLSESQAPLAHVELPSGQGLTLEDLEQWHTGVEPELQLEDVLTDETEVAPQPDRATPADPVRVLKKSSAETTTDTIASLDNLTALFAWQTDTHYYALNKREDIKRLSKQSDLLFQRVPQHLERLAQVLHAHEQCQILYDRLAELSEKRGSAALIIQTARQVEVLEKNLKEKRFRVEELKKMQADLSTHLTLVQRYQAIFQQVSALDILNLD